MMERLRYFWFWVRAYNLHGIHSPFVYELLEKAVFRKKSSRSAAEFFIPGKSIRNFSYFDKKRVRLLVKLMVFFKPGQLVWLGDNHQNMFDFLEERFSDCQFIQKKIDGQSISQNELKPVDWLVIDEKISDLETLSPIKNKLSNDSKIFMFAPNHECVEKCGARVELDFFFMKIGLFRSEMKPQVFRLRS